MTNKEVQKFIKAIAKSIEVASEHQQKMIEMVENDEDLSDEQKEALKFVANLLPYSIAIGWLRKIAQKEAKE